MFRALTRREFLKRSGLAVAAIGLGAGSSWAQEPSEFSFIALNDTHYLDEKCAAYFRAACGWIREHAEYDFALMCGDLATAERLLVAALTRQPDHTDTLFELARLMKLRGNEEDALNCLEKINAGLKRMKFQPIERLPEIDPAGEKKPVSSIFSSGLFSVTLILTLAYFLHITTFYFILKICCITYRKICILIILALYLFYQRIFLCLIKNI